MQGLYNIKGEKYKTDNWVYWYFDENNQYQEELFTEDEAGYFPKKYNDIVFSDNYYKGLYVPKSFEEMSKIYTERIGL